MVAVVVRAQRAGSVVMARHLGLGQDVPVDRDAGDRPAAAAAAARSRHDAEHAVVDAGVLRPPGRRRCLIEQHLGTVRRVVVEGAVFPVEQVGVQVRIDRAVVDRDVAGRVPRRARAERVRVVRLGHVDGVLGRQFGP